MDANHSVQALSPRERDCLEMMGSGLGAKGVATELGISSSTVEKHLSSARRKLGTKKTIEAVKVLMRTIDTIENRRTNSFSELSREAFYECSDNALRAASLIRASRSRNEAWATLQSFLKTEGYDHVILGLVAEPFGQLTNGAHLLESSFGEEVMEIYELVGGANADPVARRIAGTISNRVQPFYFKSTQIIEEHISNAPRQIANMLERFREMNLYQLYVVPNSDISTGAPFSLTLHLNTHLQKEIDEGKAPDLNDLKLLAETYWSFIKSKRYLAKTCKLTPRQIEALVFCARGFHANEAAERMAVSRRSMEKLLQGARNKLGAPTTPAAVFRANVYGVL